MDDGVMRPALADVARELDGLDLTDDRAVLRKRSRDFFWYSPVLNEQLHGLSADLMVTPKTEVEVIATAAACARHRVPLTVRGGATGNYGQAVPLHGGVLLDMSAMTRVLSVEPGRLSATSLPVLRYSTKERLDEIIACHESRGVMGANPHVVTLEEGSRHKRAEADQMGFKCEVDPMGLLNPGKMASVEAVR